MAEHMETGLLERIQNAVDGADVLHQSQPVVQVLSIKPIAPAAAGPSGQAQQERYRIIISDGVIYC